MLRNIRYALRVLARTPAFTVTIVATLAIVIGANATVFSLIDAVLLKPLPFPDADRLVLLSESREGTPISNTAPVRLEEWNEASSTLEAITGYYTEDVSETSGDLPERFRLARVAPRFHEVWGVAPAFGRGLAPADSQVGASPVVLISDRFWRARLGADPNVTEQNLAPRRSGGRHCRCHAGVVSVPRRRRGSLGAASLFSVDVQPQSLVVQRLRPSRARCVRRAGARRPRARTGGPHRTVSGNRP